MNKIGEKNGFTLMELVVVLAVLSTLLAVCLPLFNFTREAPLPRKELNRLTRRLTLLRDQAVQEEKTLALHISPDGTRLWLTDSFMDTSAEENAAQTAVETFKAIRIARIETMGKPDRETDTIRFFKRGYAEPAILEIKGLDTPVFLRLEPFLPGIQTLKDFPDLNDCS